ncbi:MAG: hypothetical protein GF344_18480 [Chitinivibrionales bacterium]|nr:hypothetical protein [Chitinivibrionales bacterium]MBD3358639.1 hypothetical protein [Chitinivibrionales bacterium]
MNCLALMLASVFFAPAAAAEGEDADVEAVSYLMGGASLFDLEDINDAIEPLGLPDVGDWAGTFGAGGDLWLKRLLLGHQLTVGIMAAQTSDNVEVRFGTAYWMAHTGINVLPRSMESLKLFPQIGIGVGLMGLKINANEFDFDQITAVGSQPDPLWQVHFLMEFGGGFDYTFSLPKLPVGIVLGTRVGYLLQIPDSDAWIRNGVEFDNGPEQRLTSLYIQGIIGVKRTVKWCKAKCR